MLSAYCSTGAGVWDPPSALLLGLGALHHSLEPALELPRAQVSPAGADLWDGTSHLKRSRAIPAQTAYFCLPLLSAHFPQPQ